MNRDGKLLCSEAIAWPRVEEESTPGLACWALSQARCFLGRCRQGVEANPDVEKWIRYIGGLNWNE